MLSGGISDSDMDATPYIRREVAEALMESKDLGIPELARQVGISESSARKILQGKNRPNVLVAGQIARLLGVSIDRLWPPQSSEAA